MLLWHPHHHGAAPSPNFARWLPWMGYALLYVGLLALAGLLV